MTPISPQQWGLRNTGQYGGNAGIDIRACDAWNLSTGSNINVAVVDQGIQLDHLDLQANIHSLSYDTENGASPSVVRGDHATACAGIIGAVGNTAGIRGVAPNCRLMSVSSTLDLSTPNIKQKLANGINWSVQNGAHVISNSWGHNDLVSSYIDDAITSAITAGRSGLGCVVVFSSGNNNGSVIYPANSNPNILSVGAMSQCGQRKSPTSCDNENTWGSNFGATLDVVAPGVLIPTTDRTSTNGYNPNIPIHTLNNGNRILTDYTNNDYTVWFNGTSSACPHVAGVAALILSVNPSLTGQQVRDIIEQTAQKVGGYNYTTTTGRTNGTWHNEMGYGLVNALCSVNRAQMYLATISGPTYVCPSGATYTVNNVPAGCTVSWGKSDNLSISSPTGNPKVFTPYGTGSGWVQATIISGTCGSVTLPRKDVWVAPGITGQYAQYTTWRDLYTVNSIARTTTTIKVKSQGSSNSFNWQLLSHDGIVNWGIQYSGDNSIISFNIVSGNSATFGVSTTNACGNVINNQYNFGIGGGYYMAISPNPATSVTTLELVSDSKEPVAENIEWSLDIYDPMQRQKDNIPKIKGSRQIINTSGWKDGVYIVRANVNGEIVTGKLVVKK